MIYDISASRRAFSMPAFFREVAMILCFEKVANTEAQLDPFVGLAIHLHQEGRHP